MMFDKNGSGLCFDFVLPMLFQAGGWTFRLYVIQS
jgi:hypothetical protein